VGAPSASSINAQRVEYARLGSIRNTRAILSLTSHLYHRINISAVVSIACIRCIKRYHTLFLCRTHDELKRAAALLARRRKYACVSAWHIALRAARHAMCA